MNMEEIIEYCEQEDYILMQLMLWTVIYENCVISWFI